MFNFFSSKLFSQSILPLLLIGATIGLFQIVQDFSQKSKVSSAEEVTSTSTGGGQTTTDGAQITSGGGQTTSGGGQTTSGGGQTTSTSGGGQTTSTSGGGQTTSGGGQTTSGGGTTGDISINLNKTSQIPNPIGCDFSADNNLSSSNPKPKNTVGACDYRDRFTDKFYRGQEAQLKVSLSGNEDESINSDSCPSKNSIYYYGYNTTNFTNSTLTDLNKNDLITSVSVSRCDTSNGVRLIYVHLPLSSVNIPENSDSVSLAVRLQRDGILSNAISFDLYREPELNLTVSEPYPKVAATNGYIGKQTVSVDLTPQISSPSILIVNRKIQIKNLQDQVLTQAGFSGNKASIALPSVTGNSTLKFCVLLNGTSNNVPNPLVAEKCQNISVSDFKFSVTAKNQTGGTLNSPKFGQQFMLDWRSITPAAPAQPQGVRITRFGPGCNSRPINTLANSTIPGRPNANDTAKGFAIITAPNKISSNDTGDYLFSVSLNLNGVEYTANSPCVVFNQNPLSVSITPLQVGGYTAETSKNFFLNFAATPIPPDAVVTGQVKQGSDLVLNLTSNDISAGRVLVPAPSKTGVFQYTVSVSLNGGPATTSSPVPVTVSQSNQQSLPSDKVLVPVIYVMSFNDNASASTVQVFKKLTENLTFFSNLPGVTENYISSIRRDYQRFVDLSAMSRALDTFRVRTGSYPTLQAGTFIPGITISKWPSWTTALGSAIGLAPVDPFNRFGNQDNFKSNPTVKLPSSQFVNPNSGQAITNPNNVAITSEGQKSGLRSVWSSIFPVDPEIVTPLALDSKSQASAWKYTLGTKNGGVIRLFDTNVFPELGTAQRADWIKEICVIANSLGGGLDCARTQSPDKDIAIELYTRGLSSGSGQPGLINGFEYISTLDSNIQISANQSLEYQVKSNSPASPQVGLIDGEDSGTEELIFGPQTTNNTPNVWLNRRIPLAVNKIFNKVAVGERDMLGVPSVIISQFKKIQITTRQPDGSYSVSSSLWDGNDISPQKGFSTTVDRMITRIVNPDINKKVQVYYDPRYFSRYTVTPLEKNFTNLTSWFNQDYPFYSQSFGVDLASKLAVRGAGTLDADTLAAFMKDPSRGAGTVIVMAADTIPVTVYDPNKPLYVSALRSYLDRGGQVIFLGERPGAFVADGSVLINIASRFQGAEYEFLSNFTSDPCPNHDPNTCWSEQSKDFACPYNSQIYFYRALSRERYQLSANFENPNISFGLPLLTETWPGTSTQKVTNYITECSDPTSLAAIRAGIYAGEINCGDGIVQPPNEDCEIGDIRNACFERKNYLNLNGTYTSIPAQFRGRTKWYGSLNQSCSYSCKYSPVENSDRTPAIPNLDESCGGFCGDGVIQLSNEACDGLFDPSVSANRCSNGRNPTCSSSCQATCSGSNVVSCYSPGLIPSQSNLNINTEAGKYDFTIYTSDYVGGTPNANQIVKSFTNVIISGNSVQIGPVASHTNSNSACGYKLSVTKKCVSGDVNFLVPLPLVTAANSWSITLPNNYSCLDSNN